MQSLKRHVSIVALASLVLTCLVGGQAAAVPLVIQPGQDGFVTTPGSFTDLPALPSGFFGTIAGNPSDPFPAMRISVVSGPNLVAVPVVTTFLTGPGCHTGMVNIHCYQQQLITLVPIYDTVVERTGGTINNPGDSLTLPGLKLVHLSLKSQDPLLVTYGPALSSFFDVFVSLDGDQGPGGTLTLHRLAETSGTMDTVLPVKYKVDFMGAPANVVVTGLTDTLQSIGNSWSVVPEPSTLLLLGSGLAGIAIFGRTRLSKKT